MIYVASPYSHRNPVIIAERVKTVKTYIANCLHARKMAFSPIVYAHDLSLEHKLPTDASYWQEFNLEFLKHCECIYVLMLDGWKESKGVKVEIEFAEKAGIPVYLIPRAYICE